MAAVGADLAADVFRRGRPFFSAGDGALFNAQAQAQRGHLVRGGFQPRLPTSLPPPGQQQQPSPLPRRQPVPLMPPAQLHPGAPQVVAPAPVVPLQSPPPSELMDVDPSAGPPSQAVAVQPVLQPLSLGTPKESDTAAPCPAPNQQPSTQRQETLPLFVGPDAPSRPTSERLEHRHHSQLRPRSHTGLPPPPPSLLPPSGTDVVLESPPLPSVAASPQACHRPSPPPGGSAAPSANLASGLAIMGTLDVPSSLPLTLDEPESSPIY
ncbi:proline-rich receptor-like protein kinase PERK10 [Schistocerca americana]|uniref:proline-rich receptor-like protein kinase PERK10 n=1 Tax=Schistocerca americana TaxID=7009 RepID=UPI001F4F21B1|nr:proline-rich receptor-like protein kinase PERK10 [Schistocerca americana]